MSTRAEIFRPNEIVHVIDESVSRWTKAKIFGIVSDWSVKIKWMGYTSIYPSMERSKSHRKDTFLHPFQRGQTTNTKGSTTRVQPQALCSRR